MVFHVFGVILWIGSLLVVTSLMTLVPDEVGAGRERLVVAARRVFHVSSNIGVIVAVLFGVFALLVEPMVLNFGWMHVKIALVLVMLFIHVKLYRRVIALENDPASATRREFSIIHGAISLILLLILIMVFLRPF
ncbi:MAG: CopD family protein [Candidatus Binataceae bacterium]|nr:CopD family protein [Candidatus Binataceae bacterium]